MNRKITLSVGCITAMAIQLWRLWLYKKEIYSNSSLIQVQFLLLFVGVFFSIFLISKYYVATLFELFSEGFKTVATVIVLVELFALVLHFILQKDIFLNTAMGILVTFGVSGALSAFVSAFILFNFGNKKIEK